MADFPTTSTCKFLPFMYLKPVPICSPRFGNLWYTIKQGQFYQVSWCIN